MPLLIHGDAAFAGQGVVAECFGLSGLQGPPHRRLDPLHHQQPDRLHHRSALLALLALSVRRREDGRGADLPRATATIRRRSSSPRRSRPSTASSFQKPVVIDMFCYRRFGHNEGDEPAFTQPLMYRKIRQHPSTLEIYAKKLVAEGVVTEAEVEEMKAAWRAKLEARVRDRPGLQAEQGRLARRPLVRPQGRPRGRRRPAPRPDRRCRRGPEGDRQRASPRCRRASTSTAPSSASSTTAAR